MNAPVKYLKDYQSPDFSVQHVELEIDLGEEGTLVSARLQLIRQNPLAHSLRLDGGELETISVRVNGHEMTPEQYRLSAESLEIPLDHDQATVETVVRIHPESNTSLEGLYRSNGMFCTQCEAEGFRKITWYPDRPDVLARFRTTLKGDKKRYPVLLSNGNPVARGDLEDGRHFVTWEDPFAKPCYLFAAVAGDLAVLEDHFTTASGRRVLLQIFAEERDIPKCHHAMESLKRAMRWDEEKYGCEYDLDIYMIVAVGHFNMGAMENKGLNVFNTSCVLAHQESTTDAGFQRVESVIAHEYFHNWSGNRVTCRDWFQLCLKEGFTVFRDQQFSADMLSPDVQRIDDLVMLRTHQFAEDASPLAHPVRPASFVEINNFYTATVYEKGAELVRMLALILGEDRFRKATDLYFSRHDGQAATVEDFVAAMQEAGERDLSAFMDWYNRPGTPQLIARSTFDGATGVYELVLEQRPSVADQSDRPFVMPVRLGLLDENGDELAWTCTDGEVQGDMVILTAHVHRIRVEGVSRPPVPVMLRGFSAPVRLDYPYDITDLCHIVAHEKDGVSRWLAIQSLFSGLILENAECLARGEVPLVPVAVTQAVARVLDQVVPVDPALAAHLLVLPSEAAIAEETTCYRPGEVFSAREHLRRHLGLALADSWGRLRRVGGAYQYQARAIGERALGNLALSYLHAAGIARAGEDIVGQYFSASNMTDKMAALSLLARESGVARSLALQDYRVRWFNEPLPLDQWFSVQASSPGFDATRIETELLSHPDFQWTNPNRVRSVLSAFALQNPVNFHAADGSGYRLLVSAVMRLNGINPQIAARLLGAFNKAGRMSPRQREIMRESLSLLDGRSGLSPDVGEMVARLLS